MPVRGLSTAKIARAVGVHPNTVRLYETWGFIVPTTRSLSGYRQFSEIHLYQMRLARLVMGGAWAGRPIRHSGVEIIRACVSGDLKAALERAENHIAVVQGEREQARAAAEALLRLQEGSNESEDGIAYHITDAARLLRLTPDILRNWERNGLLIVPRNPLNNYRIYGEPELNRLRVIRMLVRTGYSLMAVLRALNHLDQDRGGDIKEVLDTPPPDEEIVRAADRWQSALVEQEEKAWQIRQLVEEMIRKWGKP